MLSECLTCLWKPTPFPARASSIRRSSRGSGISSCSRGRVVDGFINGLHRAPYFGASIDFAEHRGYVPGDDIRRVDWQLYARTDRYFVKQYEADTNANFVGAARRVEVDELREPRASPSSSTRRILAACLGLSLAPAARPRRHRHVRRGHRHVRAAVGEALQRAAAHARSRAGRAARAACSRCSARSPSTSSAAASSR